jgi:hypothetical protein
MTTWTYPKCFVAGVYDGDTITVTGISRTSTGT